MKKIIKQILNVTRYDGGLCPFSISENIGEVTHTGMTFNSRAIVKLFDFIKHAEALGEQEELIWSDHINVPFECNISSILVGNKMDIVVDFTDPYGVTRDELINAFERIQDVCFILQTDADIKFGTMVVSGIMS